MQIQHYWINVCHTKSNDKDKSDTFIEIPSMSYLSNVCLTLSKCALLVKIFYLRKLNAVSTFCDCRRRNNLRNDNICLNAFISWIKKFQRAGFLGILPGWDKNQCQKRQWRLLWLLASCRLAIIGHGEFCVEIYRTVRNKNYWIGDREQNVWTQFWKSHWIHPNLLRCVFTAVFTIGAMFSENVTSTATRTWTVNKRSPHDMPVSFFYSTFRTNGK